MKYMIKYVGMNILKLFLFQSNPIAADLFFSVSCENFHKTPGLIE